MSMESLGGNLPAGRASAVFAGGRTHVFAIAAGGAISHWASLNGIDWQGPADLLRLNTNIEPSFLCALAVGTAAHVLAVGHGGPLSSGGPLVRWSTIDGVNFLPPIEDGAWQIPGGGNGIAASSPDGGRLDAFAATPFGLIRFSWSNTLASLGSGPLPDSLNLPRSVPAAVSSDTNVTDVFAVATDGNALRWRTTDGNSWVEKRRVLPRPAEAPAGPLIRTGFAAVSPAAGRVELFAVTSSGQLVNWSFNGAAVEVAVLPASPMPLNESIPAAILLDGHLEVFAIGQPPHPFTGGPLVRWRRGSGGWSGAKVISASLSAGGLGAAVSGSRIDVFGLAGSGLQHWPAGIGAASHEPWANWANNRQSNVIGHCHPSSEEEIVAIVKTAERTPGARVRAVGSSWSFTDIAMTPGFMVETNEINGVLTHIIDRSVLTDQAPDPKYLIHVEAGIQVEALMVELDKRGLAPFTMGGSSGQTLAGVISTSVHGSDWDRGPIPNAVRALHMVGPGGTRHWIEADQWRITDEALLRARLGPDIQIHYDDDWFDSVLVSVGSMGIITSVVLEVRDQYKREKTCERLPWSELKRRLAAGSDFVDENYYLMVAIDPAGLGDRTCYLTKHRNTTAALTTLSRSTDPLGAFCQLDAEQALKQMGTVVGIGAIVDVAVTVAQAFGIPIPVVPPGISTAVTISIIVGALKLGGPGALGDFLGSVCNGNSEGAALLVTWLTGDTLKPGETFVDVAHRIMAPVNTSECTARGLAIEMAFDATQGGHITFLDEAMAMLAMKRQQGMANGTGLVLGGYISLRFVGPSRAILSAHQSARTATIEITGLRSMASTAPLLDELEKMGTRHGAIQHWGMFSLPNLRAADLQRAYPRLDTWRRVRREIANNGNVQTFENAFSAAS